MNTFKAILKGAWSSQPHNKLAPTFVRAFSLPCRLTLYNAL